MRLRIIPIINNVVKRRQKAVILDYRDHSLASDYPRYQRRNMTSTAGEKSIQLTQSSRIMIKTIDSESDGQVTTSLVILGN